MRDLDRRLLALLQDGLLMTYLSGVHVDDLSQLLVAPSENDLVHAAVGLGFAPANCARQLLDRPRVQALQQEHDHGAQPAGADAHRG